MPHDFQVPLFHGTSTLFLDEIIEHGLGGWNPIREWRVLEFAREIRPLVAAHIATEHEWMVKAHAFGLMADQVNSGLNYQHGDTYLSPSRSQAIGYTISKGWGSELLSYSLDFLGELVRRKVPGVCDELFRRWPQIFRLLDVKAAPLLVEIRDLAEDDLAMERGGSADGALERIALLYRETALPRNNVCGPCFRLRSIVPAIRLKFWLVNVRDSERLDPQYSLYEIPLQQASQYRGINGDRIAG